MKHTQGPWKISGCDMEYERFNNVKYYNKIISCADESWPMLLEVYERENIKEQKANARLIAAAPDLLEACQFAFENLKPKGNIKKDFSGHNAIATLSRAIAKATKE